MLAARRSAVQARTGAPKPAVLQKLNRDWAHHHGALRRNRVQLVLQAEGKGTVLDQFGNLANPLAHYRGTGPEVWEQTQGRITHFVSSMGTTGTIMGTSRYLKEQNPNVKIVGLQPREGSAIAGIRRWPKAYMPTIFQVLWYS